MAPSLLNLVLFRPPKCEAYLFPTKVVELKTKEGNTIAATHIKRSKSAITMIYSHTNGDDLNHCHSHMLTLSKMLDVNVIGYDYSGYGKSTGSPSEENCYADIEAVFEYLTNERKVPTEHIILFGRSLGSGPSCYLAAKCTEQGKPLAGVILMSPFTSVYRLVMPDFIGMTLPGDAFPNIDRIRDIQAPIFLAHGEADQIVPSEHSQILQRALPQRRVEYFSHPNMTHNDIDEDIEVEMIQSMNDFLDYYVLARRLWMKPAVARLHVCK